MTTVAPKNGSMKRSPWACALAVAFAMAAAEVVAATDAPVAVPPPPPSSPAPAPSGAMMPTPDAAPKSKEAAPGESKATASASDEARRWLALVNAGQFAKAWLDAAAVLQEAVEQKDWIDGLKARREKFGRLVMEKLDTAEFSRSLPEAPPGEYVVTRFMSKYENTPMLIETLVIAKDALGEWHVAGYDIEPVEK